MTIGPFLPDPEGSRPMFRRLRELKDEIGALGQANVTYAPPVDGDDGGLRSRRRRRGDAHQDRDRYFWTENKG
jgi:hypothetical protein